MKKKKSGAQVVAENLLQRALPTTADTLNEIIESHGLADVRSARFDFSTALLHAKQGRLLARDAWSVGLVQHLTPWIFVGRVGYIHTPPNFPVAAVETAPCIFFYDGKGVFHPGWLPSAADLLARDWYEVIAARTG